MVKYLTIIISLFLISCGGGGSSSSVTGHFASGYSGSYNSSTANNWKSDREFDAVLSNGSISNSVTNPYEVMNVHKAYGYGLSGNNQTIHIQDDYFDPNHLEWENKEISFHQSNYTYDGTSVSTIHGNAVASIALGAYNQLSGGVDHMGVAYNADLYYSDYNTNKSGVSDRALHYSQALDGAPSNTAASNHSYGFGNTSIQDMKDYKSNNGFSSNAEAIGHWLRNQAGLTASNSNTQKWLNSLNTFQDNKGVIVWALSNEQTDTEAHWMAGLPEMETSLQDAWITVGTADVLSTGSNYQSRYSDCGSTAAYCVVVDSYGVQTAGSENSLISGIDTDGSSSYYYAGLSGNSFGAPMVSGAITLLTEAFPNLTPAQITDRLLATSNRIGSSTGTVDFGNGVKHGYHSQWGHGIPDLYAALQPITSSSFGNTILVGDSIKKNTAYDFENSYINTPKVFGDSLSSHFSNKNAVFHDALYGNFSYDFGSSFSGNDYKKSSNQILDNHLNSYSINKNYFYDNYSIQNGFISKNVSRGNLIELDTNSYTNLISYNGIDGYTSLNMPLEVSTNFVSSDLSNSLIFSEGFNNPFIPQNNFSFGTSITNNDNLILSFYDDSHQNTVNPTTGLVVTKSLINEDNTNSNVMIGYGYEKNGIIGADLSGAFAQNQQTPTLYLSHSFEKKFNLKNSLSIISSIGRTHFNNSYNETLINEISPIISSSFGIALNHYINAKENIIIKFYQPHRLESGRAKISVPQSHSLDGSLNYLNEDVNLSPSGRQFDLSLRYNKNILEDDLLLSFENITTTDHGHISSNEILNTSIVSINYNF